MGYIGEILERLKDEIQDLPQDRQDRAGKLVADAVLQSFKNGLEEGRKRSRRTSQGKYTKSR